MGLNGTSSVMTFESPLTSQRAGAIVVAVFALLSTLAVVFITLRTIQLATVAFLRSDNGTSRSPEILFFRSQLGRYAASLVLSNMFICSAGLINFSWALQPGSSQGSTCTAQAVLMQIGIWATCWSTPALSMHTLFSFVFYIRLARWGSLMVVIVGWAIALIAGLVPLQKNNAYGFTGLSCSVTRSYPIDIFALEALPIILAALVFILVYSVIFAVVHGKLRVNSIQELRGLNSSKPEEDGLEMNRGFIHTIVWAMFWFPLASTVLLLPFCITRILVYAGRSVSFTSNVFAEVCASMLGLVNVCLLYNTFRVVSSMGLDKTVTDTVKTFGNDASGESPIAPPTPTFSQSTLWSHENRHHVCSPTQASSNHSRDSSWSSVHSNRGLLDVEKASYKSTQMKAAPIAMSNVISPLEFGQHCSGRVPLRFAGRDAHSSRVFPATGGTGSASLAQGKPSSSMANTDAPGKAMKEPTFKSKAPLALTLPPFSGLHYSPSVREVTNKSSIVAAQLGVPVASTRVPSQAVPYSVQKLDQGNAGVFVSRVWSPENVDELNAQPCSLSCSSSDSDSNYSEVTIDIHNVRPLPPVPESNDSEQDIVNTRSPSRGLSRRTTMTTVWSQETGYTLSQPDTSAQEAYPRLMAHILVPGAIPGNKADAGGVMNRPTPLGPRAHPKTRGVVKVASQLSSRFSHVLSPKSPNVKVFTIVVMPNSNVV